jgi:hypothetical protein
MVLKCVYLVQYIYILVTISFNRLISITNISFNRLISITNSMPDESRLQGSLLSSGIQPFTESDDTRCCDNTICPHEYGHVNARNMSRIVM